MQERAATAVLTCSAGVRPVRLASARARPHIVGNRAGWRRAVSAALGIAVVLGLGAAPAYAAKIEPALQLVREGRHREAAAALAKLASKGDPDAQVSLASLYRQGLGVSRKDEAARHWLKVSMKVPSSWSISTSSSLVTASFGSWP